VATPFNAGFQGLIAKGGICFKYGAPCSFYFNFIASISQQVTNFIHAHGVKTGHMFSALQENIRHDVATVTVSLNSSVIITTVIFRFRGWLA
jgi:hypothetical protein